MNPNERTIDGKTYWGAGKAAEYLGVHRGTILAMSREKRVTHLHMGGRLWFLKEWLDSCIRHSTVIGKA